VFEYLDKDNAGVVDLAAIMDASAVALAELDDDVGGWMASVGLGWPEVPESERVSFVRNACLHRKPWLLQEL